MVDALNKRDFGEDAKKIEEAGNKGGKKIEEGAKKVEDAGKSAGESVADGGRRAADALAKVAQTITRTGASYDQQSTESLRGVADRLNQQIQDIERSEFGRPGGVGGGGKPFEWYLLSNELHNVTKELQERGEVAAYVQRFGESAARYQFGDALTNRAIQNLSETSTRTASAVESIGRRIESVFGKGP